MPDIVLQSVYDQKEREFKVQGAGLTRFKSDVLDAARRACSRINHEADLETQITLPTTLTSTITGLDEKYEIYLSNIMSRELGKMGQRPAKGMVLPTEEEVMFGIQMIMTDLRNAITAADEDDENDDVTLLGHLG